MTQKREPEDLRQAKNPHGDEDEEPGSIAASDVKDAVNILRDFDMDELREIPVLEYGARLKQGATYVDLHDPARKPFTAEGAMIAEIDQLIIPKAETPYQYWNRLIGEPTRH